MFFEELHSVVNLAYGSNSAVIYYRMEISIDYKYRLNIVTFDMFHSTHVLIRLIIL